MPESWLERFQNSFLRLGVLKNFRIDWWNGLQKMGSSYITCRWRSSSYTNFPIINSFSISLDALCMLPHVHIYLIQELAVCVIVSLSPAWKNIISLMSIFLSLTFISNLLTVYILLLDVTDRDKQTWLRKRAYITTHDLIGSQFKYGIRLCLNNSFTVFELILVWGKLNSASSSG